MLKYGEDLPKERHPPRRRDAFHGLPDLVVRRRRARRHTHRERPARQPPGHYLLLLGPYGTEADRPGLRIDAARDRKSTRLNSSHLVISYAVFCLKKKKTTGDGGPDHYARSQQFDRAALRNP